MIIQRSQVRVPGDVPEDVKDIYIDHFLQATHQTGKLMLFAGDQKVEHLNDDFFNKSDPQLSIEDQDPEHLFKIASQGTVGVFATQLGLISQYGKDYPDINYVVKMNSKTHLLPVSQVEPYSSLLWTVDDVIRLKQNTGLNIVGVGYTCYLGSEYEDKMLNHAAQLIQDAHDEGLLVVLWMYPRGKAVKDEKDAHLIAGAAGVAACLGADFVKCNVPYKNDEPCAFGLKEAVKAAGRTGVICAGGGSIAEDKFLQQLCDQLYIGGVRGNATGRNIHQKDLDKAVAFCDAISSMVLGDRELEFALKVFRGEESFKLE